MLHTFRVYKFNDELFISNNRLEINARAEIVDRVKMIKAGNVIFFNLPQGIPFTMCESFKSYLKAQKEGNVIPPQDKQDELMNSISGYYSIMVTQGPSEFLKKHFGFTVEELVQYSSTSRQTLQNQYRNKRNVFLLLAMGLKAFKNGDI